MSVETESATLTATKPIEVAKPVLRADDYWQRLTKFGCVAVQLGLLAILIKRFNLESPAFIQLTYLAFGGFVVHYWLPLAYRLPFFLFLSLAGLVMVLGGPQTVWLVGIGVVLIGICHLPLPIVARVGLLLAVTGVLVAMRANWLTAPWPAAIWPILGSMFMFRLMIYLYDLEHKSAPVSPVRSLSYFFLLPNVCFPLFPVVDYQAFCRKYYNAERHQIYQVGVRWIFRGVLHLILYRILYKHWSISPYDVQNVGDFAHYAIWLFLLYLRVSGQFHIVCGMLHLYGFNLSETHNLYFLSASFTDLWRRINIYWKDFMLKLFFNPVYFRFRHVGPVPALVIATVIVFVVTWFLHAVQWFWLRGTFLFVPHDMLFWAILGVFVLSNTVLEHQYGRTRAAATGGATWKKAIVIGLKTLATFTVMSILWSLWSGESLKEWLGLWQYALVPPTTSGWLVILAATAAVFGGAVFVARHPHGHPWVKLSFYQESAFRCAALVLLAAISISGVNAKMGATGKLIAHARYPSLNRIDKATLERGYYEDLLAVDRFNGELWSMYMKKPQEWSISVIDLGLATATNDLRMHVLKPKVQAELAGVTLKTNNWGMRDKDYEKAAPPGCYRIALLGDSHVMAHGVEREKNFETLLEDRLNSECPDLGAAFEILNFASNGYRPAAQIEVFEDVAIPFKPDALFCVGHEGDAGASALGIAIALGKGMTVSDPFLSDIVRRAGVDGETPEPIVVRELSPYGEEILSYVYRRLVEDCRKNDIRPVFVLMPTVEQTEDSTTVLRLAREAGFDIVDLSGVYDGHSKDALEIAEWDQHPNDLGHKLVADRLHDELKRDHVIPLPCPTGIGQQLSQQN